MTNQLSENNGNVKQNDSAAENNSTQQNASNILNLNDITPTASKAVSDGAKEVKQKAGDIVLTFIEPVWPEARVSKKGSHRSSTHPGRLER